MSDMNDMLPSEMPAKLRQRIYGSTYLDMVAAQEKAHAEGVVQENRRRLLQQVLAVGGLLGVVGLIVAVWWLGRPY